MRSPFDTSTTSSGKGFNPLRLVVGVVTVVVLIVCLVGLSNLVEHLDAKDIMVIQYPSGTMKVCSQPGYYGQWFGAVTKYRKRSQFWFSSSPDQGKAGDQSIPVRFNDGGHARVSGSLAWEMPAADKDVIRVHTLYGSQTAIEQQLGLLLPALPRLQTALGQLARDRAAAQLATHERVREAARAKGRVTIEAVLPGDILGAYVLLPQIG